MFYFVRFLPRVHSFCISFPLLFRSFLFYLVLFPRCREFFYPFLPQFVSLCFPARISPSVMRSLCRLEQFFFCYFIQLFREREESFYYLGARLQCLADNKPMKATFEPEGPLKSPFSPTSRFFFYLACSLSLSPFQFSFSRMFSFPFSFLLSLTRFPFRSVYPCVMPAMKIRYYFFCFLSARCVLICLPDSPRVPPHFEKYPGAKH